MLPVNATQVRRDVKQYLLLLLMMTMTNNDNGCQMSLIMHITASYTCWPELPSYRHFTSLLTENRQVSNTHVPGYRHQLPCCSH